MFTIVRNTARSTGGVLWSKLDVSFLIRAADATDFSGAVSNI